MNSVLFFDWGMGVRGNPSDKNVKQLGGFFFWLFLYFDR